MPTYAQPLPAFLRQALPKHPRVLEAAESLAAARGETEIASSARNLRVTGEGGIGTQKQARGLGNSTLLTPAVRVSKLIIDGGRVDRDIELRQARAAQAAANVRAAEEDLALQMAQAYLQVARTQDALEITRAWLSGLQDLEGMTREIRQLDRGRQMDYFTASSRVAQARSQLAVRQGALREATAQLNEIAGDKVTVEKAVPLGSAFGPPGGAMAADAGLEEVPRVAAARAAARTAGIQLALDSLYDRPRLDLQVYASAGQDAYGKNRLVNAVGMQLVSSVNILDGGAGKANVNVSTRRAAQAYAALDAALRDARTTLARDRGAEEGRVERMASFAAAVRTSQELRGLMGEQFRAGRRPLLDLLSQESEIHQAALGLSQENYDSILSRIRLAHDTGKLLKAFDIPSTLPQGE